MRRSFLQVFVILSGLAALLYLLVSLYLPSPRRLIFGVDKSTGAVRKAEHGIMFLPPHQYYRMSLERHDGAVRRDGSVRIVTRENVPVTVFFRMRFTVEEGRLPDARRLVREGWSAWIAARVSEAVGAVARQFPVEELSSPGGEFARRREHLRSVVANHLSRSGLEVKAFEIIRIEADREALLELKRAELRRKGHGAYGRVAVFGIDGADWELIQELIVDGRLPNLKALIDGGVSGSIQTIQPTISPLLWTTVATGVTPDRHGVIDFFEARERRQPVTAATRRAPALWEISDAFGRPAVVINWWTAWPPLQRATSVFGTPAVDLDAAIHPATDAGAARRARVPIETIGYPQMSRFLNVTAAEHSQAQTDGAIATFREVLARTWTDHRTGQQLYRIHRPMLLMLQFEGTDVVNHLFGPYHPPRREGVSAEAYRRYWPTVSAYYAEIDRLLGEWMRVLPEDTTVIILSAHGMQWGLDRPKRPPAGSSALSAHRSPGFFIAHGNHIRPSRSRQPVSIYDITPTILAILGLPKADEMQGTVASWALENVAEVTGVDVVSYRDLIEGKTAPRDSIDPKQYLAALERIGHVADPNRVMTPLIEAASPRTLSPQQWGLYAHFNNHGVRLQQEKKLAEATEAFAQAIRLNPTRPIAYLNLSIVLFERQQYTESENLLFEAIVRGLPNPEQYIVDYAMLYRERDMITRWVDLLRRGETIFPQSYLIASNLGAALASGGQYTDALPILERALGLHPTSTTVLNNLGLYWIKRHNPGRALDYWNRSLVIDPRQASIRQAVAAAEGAI